MEHSSFVLRAPVLLVLSALACSQGTASEPANETTVVAQQARTEPGPSAAKAAYRSQPQDAVGSQEGGSAKAAPAAADEPSAEPVERTIEVVMTEAAEVMRNLPKWNPDKEGAPEYSEEFAKELREMNAKYVALTQEAYELDPQRPIMSMMLQRRWMTQCAALADSDTAIAEIRGMLSKYLADEVARMKALPGELPTRAELGPPEELPNLQMVQAPDSVERLAELQDELAELDGAEFPFDVETTITWDAHNELRYADCMAHLGRLKLASMTGAEHSAADFAAVERQIARFIRERPNDTRGMSVYFELAEHAGMSGDQKKQREVLTGMLVRYADNEATSKRVQARLRLLDAVGAPFPPLVFRDAISGETVSTADYGPKDGRPGKLIVIYFWATWSPHCSEEAQALNELAVQFADKVQLIGVSLDEPEDKSGLADLKQFVALHEFAWPQYYEGKKWGAEYLKSWGITRIPFSMVIGTDGKLMKMDLRADLVDWLKSTLAG